MKRIVTLIALAAAQFWALAQEPLKVLAIGNSFSEDAIEQNLWEIAQAAGKDIIIGNMYIGGCTIDKHLSCIEGDKAVYRYRKIVDGKTTVDLQFRSMSAAACFVFGGSVNGKRFWTQLNGGEPCQDDAGSVNGGEE